MASYIERFNRSKGGPPIRLVGGTAVADSGSYRIWTDGKPTDLIERVPRDVGAASSLQFEIADTAHEISTFDKNSLVPRRHPGKSVRQRRLIEVNLTFRTPVFVREFRLALDSSKVQVIGRLDSPLFLRDEIVTPEDVEIVCYYTRKDKRKVLSAFFFKNESPPANVNALLARYDHYYAVDANTWNFEKLGAVSACAVLRGKFTLVDKDKGHAHHQLVHVKTGVNVQDPELSAIYDLVSSHVGSMELRRGLIGIITDTELGKLKDINARKRPLIEDFLLPPGFELVYATDASGSAEFFANQMIRECDRRANEALRQYQVQHNLARA